MPSHDTDADDPTGEHRSIWLDTTPGTDHKSLRDGVEVDTAVVGGGIAGVSTAFNLVEAGQSVAVIERDRILTGVTGHTTAKLTSLHGLIYTHLVDHFGPERTRQYAAANESAIDEIESRVEGRDIDCGFERAPAYTYVGSTDQKGEIREEVNNARRAGLPASYVESTPLPFDVPAAIRVDEQAHFHPRKYLLSLARDIPGDGSYVFERTRAVDVRDGDPCRVSTDRGEVTADRVVVATHFPVYDPALYFARMYPKRSYVLAVRLSDDAPEGMYYRAGDPYFSVRPRPTDDDSTALIGGQNHRTGHGESTVEHYRRLERMAHDRFDVESIDYRWSTQDYVSVDRVPFVGKAAPQTDSVYVATGFGGWGMTNGTAAGRILADRALGRENPHSEVFRPTRVRLSAAKGPFLDHNAHAMRHFVEDRFETPRRAPPSGLAPGEGRVVDVNGESVAVSRDADGELHAVSAVCTHMGCLVEWNDGERSWDCPCHGSRFDRDGSVVDTPAVDDLDPYNVDDLGSLEAGTRE